MKSQTFRAFRTYPFFYISTPCSIKYNKFSNDCTNHSSKRRCVCNRLCRVNGAVRVRLDAFGCSGVIRIGTKIKNRSLVPISFYERYNNVHCGGQVIFISRELSVFFLLPLGFLRCIFDSTLAKHTS